MIVRALVVEHQWSSLGHLNSLVSDAGRLTNLSQVCTTKLILLADFPNTWMREVFVSHYPIIFCQYVKITKHINKLTCTYLTEIRESSFITD